LNLDVQLELLNAELNQITKWNSSRSALFRLHMCDEHVAPNQRMEAKMFVRLAAATAIPLLLATPAFADCTQELQKLQQAAVSAETGADASKSGMPATKHQEEVMAGKQKKGVDTETTGSTGSQAEAISPHQEQVTGTRTAESADRPSQLMTEARKMAQAGDEQGCMDKVAEIKNLIGEK
jgi:hypothetical protein